ncbi:ethylene response sensor 2 [Hibiscus syriacus]|uniref:Ethylene response sensor 2 n=1 Tax=Hibiscus syriacus TaxID=106335 RepID=A0A6A3CKY4_HIBSY|nr:ethylene response sensor 2 [Hibiscus syriacus]
MNSFNEFGVDSGLTAKELIPKLDLAKKHISSQLHVGLPDIEVKQLVSAAIALKRLGAILFVFGHGFGAFLLFMYLLVSTLILYDFYNYRPEEPQYAALLGDFLQCIIVLLGVEELDHKEATKEESREAENCLDISKW